MAKETAKSFLEMKKMQRSQLTGFTKEELIESILSAPEQEEGQFNTLTTALQNLASEVADLKNAINAPDSIFNKNFTELQLQIDSQAAILVKQQRFLEVLDLKEREKNLIILGVPDENETLDGQTSDAHKVAKIWQKTGVPEEIASHRRLGDITELGTGNGPFWSP